MNDIQFQPGEYVNIQVFGARVTRVLPAGRTRFTRIHPAKGMPGLCFTVGRHTQVESFVLIPPGNHSITVERVAPPDWPPKPDDKWADSRPRNGRPYGVWFGQHLGGGTVMLTSTDGEFLHPDVVLQQYGPMTLLHREPDAD